MEDKKYFTPDISDIRIGYECEWMDSRTDWVPFKVVCPQDVVDAFNDKLRTSFLTKEQIITEGWDLNDDKLFTLDDKQLYSFSKGNFGLLFQPYNNDIQIYDKNREIYVYQEECKCINTFRYLNKLLNI